jgi:hypothetical protein
MFWEWAMVFAISVAFLVLVMWVVVSMARLARSRGGRRRDSTDAKRPGTDDRAAA